MKKERPTTYPLRNEDRKQPNDGKDSPPWRGEGDGAPVAPIKPRPGPKTLAYEPPPDIPYELPTNPQRPDPSP